MTRGRCVAWLTLTSVTVSACLQVEEPQSPGALVVEVTSQGLDEDLGFRTDDGWTISVERALVSLGEVRLMGDACDQHSENQYLRVLDLTRAGPQRLVLAYALGRCEVGFLVRSPAKDAVLGAGVDAAARAFLRAPGSDPFVDAAGVALYVEGTAERDAASVHFAWAFRQAFDYSCGFVAFDAGATQTVQLEANVSRLFAGFDALAAADTDGDAEVTLEELAAASLGEALYFDAMPRVVDLPSPSRCEAGRFEERGPSAEHR